MYTKFNCDETKLCKAVMINIVIKDIRIINIY